MTIVASHGQVIKIQAICNQQVFMTTVLWSCYFYLCTSQPASNDGEAGSKISHHGHVIFHLMTIGNWLSKCGRGEIISPSWLCNVSFNDHVA